MFSVLILTAVLLPAQSDAASTAQENFDEPALFAAATYQPA